MIRHYMKFQVTGTETLDNGREISWTETGICTEDQDPVRMAILRNPDMIRCHRFGVNIRPAFSEEVQNVKFCGKRGIMKDRKMRVEFEGYRDMRNKWNDPESIMIQRINKWEMKRDASAAGM